MTTTTRTKITDSNIPPTRVTHIEQDITPGEMGPAIYVYSKRCTVTLWPGSTNGAKVQYTTSSPENVQDETANWLDWARGTVTAGASDVPEGPIVALRGVDGGDGSVLECLLVNEV